MTYSVRGDEMKRSVTSWEYGDGYVGELNTVCRAYVEPLPGESKADTMNRLYAELNNKHEALKAG